MSPNFSFGTQIWGKTTTGSPPGKPRTMAEAPCATLLLTCCDQAHSIGGAIDSALAQVGGPFEILIIDDASRDGSWEVIQAEVAGNG